MRMNIVLNCGGSIAGLVNKFATDVKIGAIASSLCCSAAAFFDSRPILRRGLGIKNAERESPLAPDAIRIAIFDAATNRQEGLNDEV